MPRKTTVVRYLRTVVFLGLLSEFIDGGTHHFRRCHDCPTRHGWPFSYYQDPGSTAPGGWLWWGLVADLVLVLSLGAAMTWRKQKSLNRKHLPPRS